MTPAKPLYNLKRYNVEHSQVDVIRLGNLEGSCSAAYTTIDATAIDGIKYHAVKGRVLFGPGEFQKSFEIPIIDDEWFDTTLEFHIELSEPKGCELGHFLYKCRVNEV